MNELKVFSNSEFGELGVMLIDGKEYFPATQCAKLLGYARPADAISAHCKGVCVLPTPSSGGVQNTKYIPEGDLYRLIIRSRLPAAERFERWVFDDVLPSIRKSGVYGIDIEAVIAKTATAVVSEVVKQILPLLKAEPAIPAEQLWEAPTRRIRKDCSIISRLDYSLRNEIDEMLVSQQYTYEEIRQYLLEKGIRVSKSSLARRYLKLSEI
nr:MAG TPA: repressor domain protein [Caudoviricetes sp.]